MKRAVAVLVLVVFCGAAFGQSLTEAKFEDRLDYYAQERSRATALTLTGLAGVAFSFILGSTLVTLSSAGYVEDGFARVVTGITYVGAIGFSIAAGVGGRRWKRATDDYLETLRLQTRYYNLVN